MTAASYRRAGNWRVQGIRVKHGSPACSAMGALERVDRGFEREADTILDSCGRNGVRSDRVAWGRVVAVDR